MNQKNMSEKQRERRQRSLAIYEVLHGKPRFLTPSMKRRAEIDYTEACTNGTEWAADLVAAMPLTKRPEVLYMLTCLVEKLGLTEYDTSDRARNGMTESGPRRHWEQLQSIAKQLEDWYLFGWCGTEGTHEEYINRVLGHRESEVPF